MSRQNQAKRQAMAARKVKASPQRPVRQLKSASPARDAKTNGAEPSQTVDPAMKLSQGGKIAKSKFPSQTKDIPVSAVKEESNDGDVDANPQSLERSDAGNSGSGDTGNPDLSADGDLPVQQAPLPEVKELSENEALRFLFFFVFTVMY